MFKHIEDIKLPELFAETTEHGRFYTTPDGNVYPSVTTVLGRASDQTWLDDWKKRVGEEQATRISTQAARRGTAVHDIAEKYLKNDFSYAKGHMPANIATFNQIKPILDKNVDHIYGLEVPLYSDKLRTAGRVDLIAEWNSKLSIIDFKTSKRVKDRDSIHAYFKQESCYSFMFFERTGWFPSQLVTIMTVDDDKPLVFVEKARDWIDEFIKARNSIDI